MIAWLAVAGVARASSVGVGLGGAVDLPDGGEAKFGPSPNLLVPVRIDLGQTARIRTTLHAAFGAGTDEISWMVGGERVSEPSEAAYFGSVALLSGPEIAVPLDGPISPYFGGSIGLALVHTWHNIDRADLFGPTYTDEQLLGAPGRTFDPYARQLVLATDLAVGIDAAPLWAELGYALQFVPDAPLRKSEPSLLVRHEPYGWNALRLVVGVSIPLGGARE